MKEYAVIFEKTKTDGERLYPRSAGLGVAGSAFEETEHLIREGIEFHIQGLRADGEPVPEPTTRVIEISVPA